MVVEEELQMAVAADDVLFEYRNQIAKTFLKKGILPYAVKACVSFEDMKMRVHGLAFVGILVAKAHVFDLRPFAGECFEIASADSVEAVFFYRIEQFYGIFKGFSVACRAVQLRQSVYRECYRVDLLFSVLRSLVRVQRPVCASEFGVVEPVDYQVSGHDGHFKVLLC